jgi:methyl-accepting chemotaxis protein
MEVGMLKNVKIGTRLAIGFGLGVLATLATGLIALNSNDSLSTLTEKLYRHPFAVTNALETANAQVIDIRSTVKDVILAATPQEAEAAAARVAELDAKFNEQIAIVKDRFLGDQKEVNDVIDAYNAWRPLRDEVLRDARQGRRDEALTKMHGRNAEQVARIRKEIDEVKGLAHKKAAAFMDGATATRDNIFRLTIGLLVVAIATAAAAAIVIGHGIIRPLSALRGDMDALTQGKLDTAVSGQDRKDEIGDMARTVLVFREGLVTADRLAAEQRAAKEDSERRAVTLSALTQQFDQSVGGIIETVSGAAVEMEATAQSMSANAEETARQATTVAAATEQASSNVQTVATASEELSASIGEIGRQVEESSGLARTAAAEATSTTETVGELANAVSRIGEVIKLINDIASQTNLLALNATIEAARAGDAGKGFAVVASEVKNLANQTGRATDEIAAQINSVQQVTQQVVAAIDAIFARINQMNEIATTIASAMQEQGAATQEISRNVQQAAQGTQEVANTIGGVNQAAAETGTAASQVLSSAQSMTQRSEELKSHIQQFIAAVRTA